MENEGTQTHNKIHFSKKQSIHNISGQITVFLALIFFLLLGVIFLILGGIREYFMEAFIEENFDVVGEDILANYDKSLWERYHVFFLDPREKSYLVQDATDRMKEKFEENYGFFRKLHSEVALDQTYSVVQDEGKALKKQIKEWEICQGIYKLPDVINQLLKAEEKKEDISKGLIEEETSSTVTDDKKQIDDKKEEGVQEETGEEKKIRSTWKEWKDTLGSILENGILYYVAEDVDGVSNLQLTEDKILPSKNIKKQGVFFESKGISFTKLSQLKNMCKNGLTVEKNTELFTSDIYLFPYIFECYTRYGSEDKEKQHCLQYEIEYLISGDKKDKVNLKRVADQIFLLRFFINYAYAVKDPKIHTEADTMALALTGLFGFPEGKEIVTQLLIASLCYGESLLEVRALLKGDKVAIVKSQENWNLSFSNAVVKLKNRTDIIKVKQGVDYENYLMGLILLRLESKSLLYRMMDIMQCNVALEEPGFLMENCIYSFKWTGNFSWNPWIKRIPAFGIMNKNPFSIKLERDVFYR